ncbi:MAG TPA: hypothetical protein VFE47_11055 [Tepidisphaeraceae bacterium]|jgi:hypothetical protein|nr:hypothetical protein [Tepidisphaeraceae bacterium]
MKSGHLLLAALGVVSFGGVSVTVAGNRPQPTAPPIPPSWRQPPAQPAQPAPRPSNQQSQSDPNSTNNNHNNRHNDRNSNSGNGSGSSRHDDRHHENQNQNPYGYGYPYGNPYYGQPTAGVYYPGSGIGTSNGNPNAMPQNNPNANGNNGQPLFNDAPAPPDPKPTPAPVVATPPPPPDPELIQANEDVNTAMDALRQQLLKTDPEYQAAVAAKKAAQENSASVHANENSTSDQILAAATQVLDASRRVVEIERVAAATDPQVQDAQSKLKTALAAHLANAANNAAAK